MGDFERFEVDLDSELLLHKKNKINQLKGIQADIVHEVRRPGYLRGDCCIISDLCDQPNYLVLHFAQLLATGTRPAPPSRRMIILLLMFPWFPLDSRV